MCIRDRVKELTEAAQRVPPLWNPPTGRPDVDALVWFDLVPVSYTHLTLPTSDLV